LSNAHGRTNALLQLSTIFKTVIMIKNFKTQKSMVYKKYRLLSMLHTVLYLSTKVKLRGITIKIHLSILENPPTPQPSVHKQLPDSPNYVKKARGCAGFTRGIRACTMRSQYITIFLELPQHSCC
jgi:hypothetical protein